MATATITITADPRTDGVNYFDPEDYLVNILRRAVTNKQNIAVAFEGVGEIVALNSRGEYFASVRDMPVFCSAQADKYDVSVLEDGDPRLLTAGKVGRNIDELLWRAAFYASQGRLMQGCFRDDVVQLRHWPNLSRLPSTPNSIRISAFLSRYPTSITLASRLLKIDNAELYQFYSAARAAGLAHAVNRKAEEPVLRPHRNQTLLSMLLGKIASL